MFNIFMMVGRWRKHTPPKAAQAHLINIKRPYLEVSLGGYLTLECICSSAIAVAEETTGLF